MRMMGKENHIFGPVASRRLGASLGVDVVPLKTCTYDCVYCQLGRTPEPTLERKEYVAPGPVLDELAEILALGHEPDYVTFSGSGEPTLNSAIGEIIAAIKAMTRFRVAVLTNGSLLFEPEVSEALLRADVVVPSLDAATQDVLERINRPAPGLDLDRIIDGMVTFRERFDGGMWLEIMLVKGINDTPEELAALNDAVNRIRPDKVQLNTVVRPPSEEFALRLGEEEMERARSAFAVETEIVVAHARNVHEVERSRDDGERVIALLARRSAVLEDVVTALGTPPPYVLKLLARLEDEGRIRSHRFDDRTFYDLAK